MRGRSYLYEIPVFYLLLSVVQRALFPENFSFHLSSPSPYWLGILLFGLRYGLFPGLLAGAASAGLYALGFKLAGEGYRLDDADFYLQPGLFIVFGAVMGGVIDRYRQAIASLDSRIEELTGKNRGLLEQIRAQDKAQRVIEQQVVSQMSSLVTLYHGSRNLASLERGALFTGMLDFFTQALSAEKTALFVQEGERWVLREERGWAKEDPYPRSLGYTEGIIGKAGSEKRVASLRDWLGEDAGTASGEAGKSDAIMAAPILDPAGETAAVFSVQAMPLLRFNSASVNLQSLLAGWGAEALAKVAQFEELKSHSIFDESFGVHNERYFQTRSAQEFRRSVETGHPFSLLLASPLGIEGLSAERREMFLHALCRVLREASGPLNIVTTTPFPEAPFSLLMPASPAAEAAKRRENLLSSYANLGLDTPLRVAAGSFGPDTPDLGSFLARTRQELRG